MKEKKKRGSENSRGKKKEKKRKFKKKPTWIFIGKYWVTKILPEAYV